ncbi:MAG: hypothetical protein V7642_5533 [Burkholderiales bacterium]
MCNIDTQVRKFSSNQRHVRNQNETGPHDAGLWALSSKAKIN